MRKVLIVDDDPVIRAVLEECLDQWGYQALVTTDGGEGWHAFLENPEIHIAVIDWVMPEPDGVALIRMIRDREQSESRPTTYLILLTSQSGRDNVIQGLRAGADDYLLKGKAFKDELRARLKVAEQQIQFEEMVAQQKAAPDDA